MPTTPIIFLLGPRGGICHSRGTSHLRLKSSLVVAAALVGLAACVKIPPWPGRDAGPDAVVDAGDDADATEADGPASVCECDCDVDSDGSCRILDFILVRSCVSEGNSASCAKADIDCDGAITPCDTARALCLFLGRTDCCGEGAPCGACCESDACALSTVDSCESHCGLYGGDDSACADAQCSPLPEAGTCDLDLNGDGRTDIRDVAAVGSRIGSNPNGGVCAVFDVNSDEVIDTCDLEAAVCAASNPTDCCNPDKCGG